jgi:type I restriction enzyme M protein
MFEQSFKNIDDILHRDAGCATELDYIEQTSWILFLKYLDDLEETRKRKRLYLESHIHTLLILNSDGMNGQSRKPLMEN